MFIGDRDVQLPIAHRVVSNRCGALSGQSDCAGIFVDSEILSRILKRVGQLVAVVSICCRRIKQGDGGEPSAALKNFLRDGLGSDHWSVIGAGDGDRDQLVHSTTLAVIDSHIEGLDACITHTQVLNSRIVNCVGPVD